MVSSRADVVDVGVVAVAGKQQVAVGQHGALRAGRWCRWCRTATLRLADRPATASSASPVEQRRVVGGAGGEDRRQRVRDTPAPTVRSASFGLARHKLDCRVGHDPGHLARMQLAVERDGSQTGAPDGIQRRQELRTVFSSPAPRALPAAGRAVSGGRRRCAGPAPRAPAWLSAPSSHVTAGRSGQVAARYGSQR